MAFKLENTSAGNKQNKTSNKKESLLTREIHLFGHSFSNKLKENFYVELNTLLKAGVTLKESLQLLAKSQKKKVNKEVLETVTNAIVSGKGFSEAIQSQKVFSKYEYFSLKIGEETGSLSEVTAQLGDFFARKNQQRRDVVNALTYPIIILVTAILVVLFMLRFVVPMFENIFKQQKAELPALTRFIIKLSDFVGTYGWFTLFFIVLLITLFFFFKENQTFKKIKTRIVRKLPIVGSFIENIYLSQFSRAVWLLTSAKVPMSQSIDLVNKMIDYFPLNVALQGVKKDLLRGKSLSQSLSKHNLFEEKMITMVKVAEETNQNEFIFKRLSEQFSTKITQQSKLLSTALEPFIIVVVGSLVGVILVAMYLPMFKLSSVLG